MYLIDGRTKNVLDSINLGGNVEASPAVYNNTVVVGTRAQKIWGINISWQGKNMYKRAEFFSARLLHFYVFFKEKTLAFYFDMC